MGGQKLGMALISTSLNNEPALYIWNKTDEIVDDESDADKTYDYYVNQ